MVLLIYWIVLVLLQFTNVKHLSHYPIFKTYHGRFIYRFSIMRKWWKMKQQKQNRVQTNKKRIQINLNRYLTHAQLNCSETGAHGQLFSFFLGLFSHCGKKKQKQKKRKKKKKNKRKSTKDWCSSGLLSFSCWLRFFFFLLVHFKKKWTSGATH